ncbi:hypothetical protein [Allocoleopsis sp.]|uniref:hypothetical protein n=1 Tax=Allocoleopsis sp. TaxID=3088169 RepID=UPI002FD3F358
MIDFDSFLPEELTIALKHPLEQNLDLPIPDPQSASVEDIREIQRRDRIPGVVKRFIFWDADTFWEYWWCVPGRILLPEDVQVLTGDRSRVESIIAKLIWLFGGFCFTKDSHRNGEQLPVHDWQDVLQFAQQQGFESYLLDIDFMPLTIKRDSRHSNPSEKNIDASYIAVEPAHWHIEFLQLIPTMGGFELQEQKTVCSCQIWSGKPFLKHVPSGISSVRYDLWIARPMNITQPSWFK